MLYHYECTIVNVAYLFILNDIRVFFFFGIPPQSSMSNMIRSLSHFNHINITNLNMECVIFILNGVDAYNFITNREVSDKYVWV
jgi:hypothetical protein